MIKTLDELFAWADIEDVYEDPNEGTTELTFVIRDTKERRSVTARDLPLALADAERVVARETLIHELQREGLSVEDIDRLAADRIIDHLSADQAWERGYEAGFADADTGTIAASAPAAAVAAEPFEVGTANGREILDQYPLLTVVYAPVAIVQNQKS
jgi:hypothetical protein